MRPGQPSFCLYVSMTFHFQACHCPTISLVSMKVRDIQVTHLTLKLSACLVNYKIQIDLKCLYVCVPSCSVVSDWATLRTAACHAPSQRRFSRQEYWSGLPCPPPGDLPNPGIRPGSPALQADSLPAEPSGKPILQCFS